MKHAKRLLSIEIELQSDMHPNVVNVKKKDKQTRRLCKPIWHHKENHKAAAGRITRAIRENDDQGHVFKRNK